MSSEFATAMRRAYDHTRARKLSAATREIQAALAGVRTPRAADQTGKVIEHDAGKPRRRPARPAASPAPDGAQFVARDFTSAAGSRDYKLYVPSNLAKKPRGLIVMLHGCTQNPDDFAAGTGMNIHAENHGILVVYPAQPMQANQSRCWNWFSPRDQQRDLGEPAIIAGMTLDIAAEYGVAKDRIFVAGLSAGGAMAAILAETYPELFNAAGIHSGLAYRSASDVASAFAAMRGQGRTPAADDPSRGAGAPRIIVFHGTADRTVHHTNGQTIFNTAQARLPENLHVTRDAGVAGSRSYDRTIAHDRHGTRLAEHWSIEGAGHAWSGGHAAGSYADPDGPDASAEMLRFFLAPASKDPK
jgi:poly(hydroxyalkanoate) depolymerase family esterase